MINIGNVELNGRTVLAPMAGVNNTSFRLLCKKYGCSLVFTQMYDVSTIIEKKKCLESFLNINENETPIGIQLIGKFDDDWELCISLIEKYCDIIDLNFGCPMDHIIDEKKGAYLLQTPHKIGEIVKRCTKVSNVPITVKIRTGYDSDDSVVIAKLAENNGASAITIHARTYEQKYGGKADLNVIKNVKAAVNIPVIGNGDVSLPGHAKSMIERTKCDMVMIGRAAKNNPSIFQPIEYIIEFGKSEKYRANPKKLLIEYFEYYNKFENRISVNELKDHCIWINKLKRTGKNFKDDFLKCESVDEIKNVINDFK